MDTLDALVLLGAATGGLGWLMAGHALRPLRTITATVRRSTSLMAVVTPTPTAPPFATLPAQLICVSRLATPRVLPPAGIRRASVALSFATSATSVSREPGIGTMLNDVESSRYTSGPSSFCWNPRTLLTPPA